MAYVPSATDPTRPIDSDPAESAALEFRTLKAFVLANIGGTPFAGTNFWRKNMVVNGGMEIDQRNAGAAVVLSTSLLYSADKWVASKGNGVGTIGSIQQQGAIFTDDVKSIKYAITVAALPFGASQPMIATTVEAYDMQWLQWGTANAAPVSLSFNCKASIAGQYSVALRNSGATRSYVAVFNIAAPNVAQKITIPNIPGDVAGAWSTTTGKGIEISFDAGAVATFETPAAGAWQVGNYTRVAGTVVVDNNVMNISFSNVQLEQAAASSAFERLPIEQRLAFCYRYYQKSFPLVTAPASALGKIGGVLARGNTDQTTAVYALFERKYTVSMRVSPTLVFFSPAVAGAQSYDYVAGANSGTPTDAGESGIDLLLYKQDTFGGGGSAYNELVIHYTANADFY